MSSNFDGDHCWGLNGGSLTGRELGYYSHLRLEVHRELYALAIVLSTTSSTIKQTEMQYTEQYKTKRDAIYLKNNYTILFVKSPAPKLQSHEPRGAEFT